MSDDGTLVERSKAGYRTYTPFVLSIYDVLVHRINNRFAWKCPTENLIRLYNENITANHLEIGAGTGFLLDQCLLPASNNARLVLCDMNPNCLEKTRQRLNRYAPTTFQRNILEPLEGLGTPFDSVSLNYVLHCVPDDFASKQIAFQHIAEVLKPGGVLFGSTLLSQEVPVPWFGRLQMRLNNRSGVFANANDSLSALNSALDEHFASHETHVHGCAALFTARTLA